MATRKATKSFDELPYLRDYTDAAAELLYKPSRDLAMMYIEDMISHVIVMTYIEGVVTHVVVLSIAYACISNWLGT